jgi:hypothetical protein
LFILTLAPGVMVLSAVGIGRRGVVCTLAPEGKLTVSALSPYGFL